MALQAAWRGILALRVLPLVPLLLAFGVVLVPTPWTPQQASIWPQHQSPAWPHEGSTVEYELASSFTTPDGSYQQQTTARLTLTYDGTAWTGSCEWTSTEVVDRVAVQSEGSSRAAGEPPSAPEDASVADTVVLALLDGAGIPEGCQQRGETVEVVRAGSESLVGEEIAEASPYLDVSATWDRETGLVLEWSRLTHGGSATGRLVAPDASLR